MLFFIVIKTDKPIIAANADAIKILNLELFTSEELVKARLLIKMDIVNPMPPRQPIPAIFLQVKPSCKLAKPAFTKIKGIENIPISFPATRPNIMPAELEFDKLPIISVGIIIAVLTKAKMGRIINATGLCKKC